MSLVQELRVYFTIPKQRMSEVAPTPQPNEVVKVFIDFLLQILKEIMRLEPDFIVSVKGSFQNLQTELGFLTTFLGDVPMRLQFTEVNETKNILSDIKVVVNEFELLETKIKVHCITVSKLSGSVDIKSSVVSLFIVDSLLDDLEDLINYKAERIVGVKDLITILYEEVTLLRSTFNDIAVARHIQLEELMIQTRVVAYEVEYVINSFPPIWYLNIRLPQILEKIQLIKMAIQEKNRTVDAGIREEGYPCGQVLPYAKESPHLEDIFVGFKDEKRKILEQLTREPHRQQIISVVGMPGLGKTTLAKKLFDDPSIFCHFDKRAWCVVSQKYKKKNLLIEMLTSTKNLNKKTILKMEEEMDGETLGEQFYKSLKGTRYLIIMDDLWQKEMWEDLKKYFPNDESIGSRILFMTRNKEVGSLGVVNELPFLSEAECWELLKKVFRAEPCPPGLLEIGKEIASSCHRLPLSVLMISSVLANMEKKESSWITVAGSLSTHIFDHTKNCLHVLKLSYQHLSVHLKHCFLYFGVFAEDEVIPVRKLISLWVAEGFINKETHKSSEDVAYHYLMDLIHRGLVLVHERTSNGGVKTCIIHDLLHDMCLRDGIKIGSSIYEQDGSLLSWLYLSYPRPFGPHVHSVLGRRVMDLTRSYLAFDNISKGIEKLVHLRYLASIENLHKLEYLLVKNKEQVEIPEIVLNMKNLKHLHFRGGAYFSETCHLRATKDGSFQLNLQSISLLVIRNEMDAKVLGCAPNLRRLKCKFQCPFQFPDRFESLKMRELINSLRARANSEVVP
ncbi:putative late blight resistance protein homolog R1B-12 [Olea europaea var. sylvestris]|uniref:putative late blight resistance protein homolog R1B-12 n=1 Tax=Olea europaea var. sylvestris TaxID=158386 RepID=UPI000C1D111F|nr:putative late blight resistance protein homolog R1B-12 [Olea europaea var. sylvestris]